MSYTEDVNEEFDQFESTIGINDRPLGDYVEWLEEVVSIASMRLAAAREDMGK